MKYWYKEPPYLKPELVTQRKVIELVNEGEEILVAQYDQKHWVSGTEFRAKGDEIFPGHESGELPSHDLFIFDRTLGWYSIWGALAALTLFVGSVGCMALICLSQGFSSARRNVIFEMIWDISHILGYLLLPLCTSISLLWFYAVFCTLKRNAWAYWFSLVISWIFGILGTVLFVILLAADTTRELGLGFMAYLAGALLLGLPGLYFGVVFFKFRHMPKHR